MLIGFVPAAGRASMAASYAGIYIIIDPYNPVDIQNLSNAATTLAAGCRGTGTATPFCADPNGKGFVSGIFLAVKWCSWELANVTLGVKPQYQLPGQSCYYYVDPTAGGTPISQVAGGSGGIADNVSPCVKLPTIPQFDTCTIAKDGQNSQLATTLGYIKTINAAHIGAGLPALKLSVGLQAGYASAMRFIYNLSNPPVTFDLAASIGSNYCVRVPNFFDPSYEMGFTAALDALIVNIQAYDPSFQNVISIVKAAPVSLITNEFDTGGSAMTISTATDSRDYTPDSTTSSITCSKTQGGGAARLLGSYNSQHAAYAHKTLTYPDCRYYAAYSQAVECLSGLVVGNIAGTLKRYGLTSAIEAIDTNNGNAVGDIDCGKDGSGDPASTQNKGICYVRGDPLSRSTMADQWSTFYVVDYVQDMVSQTPQTPVAQSAAQSGFNGAGPTGVFTLAPSQLAITFTGLNFPPSGVGHNFFTDPPPPPPPPPNETSIKQVGCALNNTQTGPGAPAFSYLLDGVQQSVLGVNTVLAWQEVSNALGINCGTLYMPAGYYPGETNYEAVLSSAYLTGGQYTEIYPNIVFSSTTNFTGFWPACAPDLVSALIYLQTMSVAPGTCAY